MNYFIRKYGFWGFIRLVRDTLYTKLFHKGCRIIRLPAYIRWKKYISIGKGFTSGVGLRIEALPDKRKICIIIGTNVQVNDYVHIGGIEQVKIGNNVLIASKVFISDHNHGNYNSTSGKQSHPLVSPIKRELYSMPVIIEDNVWIGEHVSILPGVTIGKGSIIGAMSLVNKEIPPFSIAVGIPAKVIKRFNFENQQWETIKSL